MIDQEIGLEALKLMTPETARELVTPIGKWLLFCQKLKTLQQSQNQEIMDQSDSRGLPVAAAVTQREQSIELRAQKASQSALESKIAENSVV